MTVNMQELEELTATLLEPDLVKILDIAIDDNSIVGKYLWKEKRVAVQLLAIKSGIALPVNFRNELEVLIIFDGALQVEMGGGTMVYKRGDIVKILAGMGHICQAITDVKLIAISIPASEEYPDD